MTDPTQPENPPAPTPPAGDAGASVPPPGYAQPPTYGAPTTPAPPLPYGAQPVPPVPPTPKKGGMATAALILGIIGVVFAFTPAAGLGIVLGILALIFGIISLTRGPAKRGVPLTGTILGALALVLGIIFAAVYSSGTTPSADNSPAAANAPAASASAAPKPSTAPKPSKAPKPPANPNAAYDTAFGTFKQLTQAGTGDAVIKLPAGAKTGIVAATHQGSANFSVSALDSNNQPTGDLLVNTIGNYSGVTAFGFNDLGNDPVTLQVQADGNWSLTIAPVSAAPVMKVPGGGTGDQVFKYDGGAATWTINNTGQGNFSVIQYGGTFPNLAVNEIGNYAGSVPMQAGPSVVVIGSDGTWSVK